MAHSAISSLDDLAIYSDPLSAGYTYDTRRDSSDSVGYDPTDIDSRRHSRIANLDFNNPTANISTDSITQYNHDRHDSVGSTHSATYPPSTSHAHPNSASHPTPQTPTRRSRARAFSFLQPQTPTRTVSGGEESNPFETDDYATAFELGHEDDDPDEDEEGVGGGYAPEGGAGRTRRFRTSFQGLSKREVGWMMASGGVVLGLTGVAVVLVSV